MTQSPSSRQNERRARIGIVIIGFLLPSIILVPFGSVWLWQNGYLIPWATGACAIIAGTYLLQRWLLPSSPPVAASQETSTQTPEDEGKAAFQLGWSPLEEQAMDDVEKIVQELDLKTLQSRDDFLKLAGRTIEAVAKRLHPERKNAIWQFTPPEAFAIIERVSRRLRVFVSESVPFGDKITVAQALTLYRWRGAVGAAEKAWDLWRLLRLANPVTAAAHEVRERLSNELIQWGRTEILRRMAAAYVREVGRAAIDLYGGRLRIPAESLGEYTSSGSAADADVIAEARAEPLRVIVGGQVSAGKSSLINALGQEAKAAVDALPATARFTPYTLEREGLPAALIIDSPGIDGNDPAMTAFLGKAAECDLVLWVVAANRADRAVDQQALQAFRTYFAERLNRRRPPVLLVATHIDRLRPLSEWSPPYDLEKPNSDKARTIAQALEAIREDLGFEHSDAVAVAVPPDGQSYNLDAVWEAIAAAVPEATRAQLLRCITDLKTTGWEWRTAWRQTKNFGGAIAGSLKKTDRPSVH